MFPETSRLILRRLTNQHLATIVNLGSGLQEYWVHTQPWIFESLMAPCLASNCIWFNVDEKPETAPQCISHVYSIAADAAATPFQNETADIVLCTSLLEHTEKPEAVIREARRLIKFSGMAFFEVPFHYELHPDPIDTGLRIGTREEWEKLLGSSWNIAGFWVIESNHKPGASCSLVEARPV